MVKVGSISRVSFNSNNNPNQQVTTQTGENLHSEPIQVQQVKHTSSVKNGIATGWKFLSVANQMIHSTIVGLVYGALTGSTILGGSWLFNSLPKAFTKEGPSLWATLRHPINSISKSGKFLAGGAALAVLAYNVIAGKLQANQNTAMIDHKLRTGHRDI